MMCRCNYATEEKSQKDQVVTASKDTLESLQGISVQIEIFQSCKLDTKWHEYVPRYDKPLIL